MSFAPVSIESNMAMSKQINKTNKISYNIKDITLGLLSPRNKNMNLKGYFMTIVQSRLSIIAMSPYENNSKFQQYLNGPISCGSIHIGILHCHKKRLNHAVLCDVDKTGGYHFKLYKSKRAHIQVISCISGKQKTKQ